MGRGTATDSSTDILYGDVQPRSAAVTAERCVIVATMIDAPAIEDAILHSDDLVPDLDHIKVPTENMMEITINASEEEARRQLTYAMIKLQDVANTLDHTMAFSIDEVHRL